MSHLFSSLRVVAVTMLICVVGYALLILAIGQVFTPATANGSLVRAADGTVVGSTQIAQDFTQPGYFWSRPSAVDYNGQGAGGSNLSPTSTDLVERATETVERYGATADRPVPADLVAASGAGLDPHISLAGALYQAPRVVAARDLSEGEVRSMIEAQAFFPGGVFTDERLINVLELNFALDARQGASLAAGG